MIYDKTYIVERSANNTANPANLLNAVPLQVTKAHAAWIGSLHTGLIAPIGKLISELVTLDCSFTQIS